MFAVIRTSAAAAVVLSLAAPAPAAAPEPSRDDIRAAITRSLPLLTRGAAGHISQRTCFACHNQALPMLAQATALPRGFEASAEEMRKNQEFIAAFLEKNRDNYLQGRGTGGQAATATYALFTLELGGWKPDATTAAVAEYLLLTDKDLDHWVMKANRPPTESSPFTNNYLALRALQKYGTPEQQDRIARRTEQVRGWLQKTPGKETEDRAFRVAGLKAAGAPAEDIRLAAQDLLQTQRPDGGWAQLDNMDSDAYATGSALVLLHEAGALAPADPAYQRGLRFLLQSQQEDGSWHVRSRSKPFQPYYESGFPHGKDQFISIAASGWATTALALACPPVEPKQR